MFLLIFEIILGFIYEFLKPGVDISVMKIFNTVELKLHIACDLLTKLS